MSTAQHRAGDADRGRGSLAVVTVSDSRVEADDHGGAEAARLIAAAGFPPPARRLVRDDREAIGATVRELVAPRHGPGAVRDGVAQAPAVDAIILTGGTGFSPRDVTVEALVPLFERHIDGFGELFRMLSFAEIGPAAMLSRATAGIVAGVPVFLTPGSPAGVRLAVERLILPELRHLLGQLRRPHTAAADAPRGPSGAPP